MFRNLSKTELDSYSIIEYGFVFVLLLRKRRRSAEVENGFGNRERHPQDKCRLLAFSFVFSILVF